MSLLAQICPGCAHQNRPEARFCGRCGARLEPYSLAELPPGYLLGPDQRYRIERLLGQGGFGQAYLATDTRVSDRPCVIKRLLLGAAWDEREQRELIGAFAREALLLATLNTPGHPAIPDIYEYLPDQRCLVMKYVVGQNLAQLLNRRLGGLSEEVALSYTREVCAALAYMHSRRPQPVLHRDVKPANILLDSTGRIWLIDFGIAKGLASPLVPNAPDVSQAMGTPGFSAPEQWRGAAEPRSDVYALGVTLLVLLTNQPASSARAQAPQVVRPEVLRLIDRMVAPRPADRLDAQELLEALDALLGRGPAPEPPEPARPPDLSDFVGRMAELKAFAARLAEDHIALITGLAGVGKTSLAAALARREGRPERTFWHRFSEGEGGEALTWALAGFAARFGQPELWRLLNQARASGARPPPPDTLTDYLIQIVRTGNFLICLDDLHHAGDDSVLAKLLDSVRYPDATSRLIITARHSPGYLAAAPPLGGLALDDARALLARQNVAVHADLLSALLTITEGNAQFLLLAAERLRQGADPASLIERLAAVEHVERYLLREVDADLAPEERAAMEAVAVLLDEGGTRAAIEVVGEREGLRRTLASLAQRHLLIASETSAGTLYRQHAIVRGFYYEGIGRSARRELHRRAAAYYALEEGRQLTAAQHYARAGDPARAFELTTTDIWVHISAGNVRQLRDLLAALPRAALNVSQQVIVACTLAELATVLGESVVARARYQECLAQIDLLPHDTEAMGLRARVARGMAETYEQEEPREALLWLERGLEYVNGSGTVEEGLLYHRLGAVQIAAGAYEQALVSLERSLSVLPAHQLARRADVLVNIGVVCCAQGNVRRGMGSYEQALRIYQQLGNSWRVALVWQNIAIEEVIAGEWVAAAEHFTRALSTAEHVGSVSQQAEIALGLGILYNYRGELADASRYLLLAVDVARRHSLNELLVLALSSVADLQLRLSRVHAAMGSLVEAEGLARAMGARYQLAEIERGWALVELHRGRVAEALSRAETAVELARDIEDPREQGIGLRVLGQALAAAGQLDRALVSFEASLELLEGHDIFEAARTRGLWGLALLAAGEITAARPLLDAAQSVFRRLGADEASALTTMR